MSKQKTETSAKEFFPDRKSLKAFRDAAAHCKACDLWKRGTQTVFGDGARHAESRICRRTTRQRRSRSLAANLSLGRPGDYLTMP